MTRLNSFLVVVLCVLAALVFALSALPARAQLSGRQQTPVGNGSPSDNLDNWEVIGVAIRHRETGEVRVLPLTVLVVPTPTDAPPTATLTPSATPSPTLTPTPTPTPTSTNTSTATPADVPTQELTPPGPPTPGFEKLCVLKTGSFGIRVRSTPSLTGAIKDIIPAGSVITVDSFVVSENYLWAHIFDGWMVTAEISPFSWWVYGIEGTELCEDVSGYPTDKPLPTIIAGTDWGVWVGQGADTLELIEFGKTLKAAGITPAATVMGNAEYANNLSAAGFRVAFRPYGAGYYDCPDANMNPVTAAQQRWNMALSLSKNVSYRWLVLNNECEAGWSVWWYKTYLAETLRLAEASGKGRGLVPHVFGAGSPELSWFGILQPELVKLRDLGGGFGWNSYPVKADAKLCSDDPYVTWTTYRYKRFSLPEGLPIVITEFASGWGASVPDFNDIRCYTEQVEGWPIIFATAWYNATPLHPWEAATLKGSLSQLAAALVPVP